MTCRAHLHAAISEAQESNIIDLSQRFTDKRLTREIEADIVNIVAKTRQAQKRLDAYWASAERHVELPADSEWQEG